MFRNAGFAAHINQGYNKSETHTLSKFRQCVLIIDFGCHWGLRTFLFTPGVLLWSFFFFFTTMSGLDSRFPPLKVESRLMMFPNSQITSSEFYQHSTELMTIIGNKIIKQHQNSPALINFFRKGFVCLLSLDFSFLFITTPGSPFMLFTSDKSTFSCLPTCDDSLCGVLL